MRHRITPANLPKCSANLPKCAIKSAGGLGTSCVHDVGARMRGNWNVDGGIVARRDHALG